MRKRRAAAALLAAGLVLGAASAFSEFFTLSYWSPIRNLPTTPYQHFIELAFGELRVGRRGTAGFFNRRIPNPGFDLDRTSPIQWRNRRVLPQVLHYNFTHWLTIPLWPFATFTIITGTCLVIRHRLRPGHCPRCGYNLAGVPPGPCPECGAILNSGSHRRAAFNADPLRSCR